jgi:SAM-dependent methyltransferase
LTDDSLSKLRQEWDRHAVSYDLVYGTTERRRVEQERAFLEWAFDELAERPIHELLDLTAGTGLQTVELARAGFAVTAADLSEPMLERCRARAAAAGVVLAGTICRPVQATDEISAFDACISCFGSLNFVTHDSDLVHTFAAVHRALRPGGLFVFDLNNLLEDALSLSSRPTHERSGEWAGGRYHSVMSTCYDSWNALLSFTELTRIEHESGQVEPIEVTFTNRGYTRCETLHLLADAGFDDVRCFRGYTDRGASEDDRVYRLVFACLKHPG